LIETLEGLKNAEILFGLRVCRLAALN